ncbi:MAG: hypothetical protein C5B51_02925 [Terriglobia bacterium]|nr:MAG: hypothetical protein C5B51_02925 [Terriglobia bacterium]
MKRLVTSRQWRFNMRSGSLRVNHRSHSGVSRRPHCSALLSTMAMRPAGRYHQDAASSGCRFSTPGLDSAAGMEVYITPDYRKRRAVNWASDAALTYLNCLIHNRVMKYANAGTSGGLLIVAQRLLNWTRSSVFLLCGLMATASHAQTFTTLANFNGANGYNPNALVLGSDGSFYGTTQGGGSSGNGTVFKITTSGAFTMLYNFAGSDGATPRAGLIQATDGNFYGTTSQGGVNGQGTVFKITAGGTLTTLHSFGGTDGSTPAATVVQASDGNFYGTTSGGGANGHGTVFRITAGGTFSRVLADFVYYSPNTAGAEPLAALLQAKDGSFWGTTYSGGGSGLGLVFQTSASGGYFNVPYYFGNGRGTAPTAALIQAADGNLYGTASQNGPGGQGTVFSFVSPFASAPQVLYAFAGPDGANPNGTLIQATDGNFYGTTSAGGANGRGTVFKLALGGTLTTLHHFAGADGAGPKTALIQGTDGNFYGTTSQAGNNGGGTVFRLALNSTASPAPSISEVDNAFSNIPNSPIQAGTWVAIKGTNLANTNPGRGWNANENFPTSMDGTSVTINNKPAFVYYISPTQVNVQAPSDTAVGPVNVVVTNNGASAGFTAQLQPFSPALLQWGGGQYSYAEITRNSDNALIGNPSVIPGTVAAKAGDILTLWVTGLGATNPAVPAGQQPIAVNGNFPLGINPTVTVGGRNVTVIGTILRYAGLYQVNIQLPVSIGTGNLSIQVLEGSYQSPANVLLTVQ